MSANVVSTIIGVVGGVPIGVSIVRWQEGRATAADTARRKSDVEAARSALTSELEKNDVLAAMWTRALSGKKYAFAKFSVAHWDVLRESGALAGLDVGVLGRLAEVYEQYATFNRFHDLLLEAIHYPGMIGRPNVDHEIAESMAKVLNTLAEKHDAAWKAFALPRPRIDWEN